MFSDLSGMNAKGNSDELLMCVSVYRLGYKVGNSIQFNLYRHMVKKIHQAPVVQRADNFIHWVGR